MDPFINQLSALCREHVTRNKWVFVPSHALGRTLGERIALGGTNWLNLRFVTPLDVALRMGAAFLVERGIDPSEEGLGPALIMRLQLELPVEAGYFRPLADQPTMAQALWSTVRELRMACVEVDDLKREAFQSAAKHSELRMLLRAYEEFLAENDRGDMAAVYEEAMRHPDWCPIQPEDCWTEMPDIAWALRQRRLIDAMPGERIAPCALELQVATMPRRLLDRKIERVQPDRDLNTLAFLMAPAASQRSREAQTWNSVGEIQLFHAGGREAEIEEVLRRILASGAPLDEVEIACASDAHVALVWEKALRHEWPVTLGPGIPAAFTRPGRALIGLCDWIETDFSAAHLRRLLQSGDIGLEEEDEGFTPPQAARILARAETGWGRATYQLTLGALRKDYEARAKDPDRSDDERDDAARKAALTSAVLGWIVKLIAAVPEPGPNGHVLLQPIVDGALHYIKRSTARSSQLDHRAGAALAEHVGELRALGSFTCSLSAALRFVRERVQSLQVAPERPRPGHLHVCRLAQPVYAGRPRLFVVGLEEGRVFPTASEDPVLLDAERVAISPALRLSSDRIDEAVYGVLARLATWGGSRAPELPSSRLRSSYGGQAEPRAAASITFSYSTRDTREFRETYASWLMLQAFRLQQSDATLSYREMKAALREPVSSLPLGREAASSLGGWWLRSVVGTGAKGIDVVEAAHASIAGGRKAEAARDSVEFTEFDGYVSDAGVVLDPCAPGNAFAVTDLEGAASCPFRFFLKRGLGLRPVDERERDRDVWLDPLTRGSELHDIYAALLRRTREAKRRPTLENDSAWLKDLAHKRLNELRCEMPPATAEIFDCESKDFLADVDLFLEAECRDSPSTPIAFEVSFGRPLTDDVEALARVEPVEIDLGEALKFRIAGRIDRIDQVAPGVFEVLDYKTGGYWRDDWKGTFNGGRRLQHALYGLAAVELLRSIHKKPQVGAGVYYFSSHKGRQERVRISAPTWHQIATVLGDLRGLIVQGTFVHASDENDCRFCDYAGACGDAVHAQAERKLQDSKLVAYGRLAAHD
jgi:RecB family exonuclease